MNIMILDDELYLAQKVASRLFEQGHLCENYSSYHEALSSSKPYDVILLSTNLNKNDCEEVIKKYKNAIVILLVSYVSDVTVSKPIKAGAEDYVVKPFIMDELIRKIYHYRDFNLMKKELEIYKKSA